MRSFLKGVGRANLSIIFLICYSGTLFAKGDVYVFVPSDVRVGIVQKGFESACESLSVKVFGRSKDLRKFLKSAPPKAILTLPVVLDGKTEYNTLLQGYRKEKADEKLVLVSLDKAVDLSSLSGKKIGAIDLLGRKSMAVLVNKLLKSNVKVKRVTKQEDLLPLLLFGAADAILTSEKTYETLKSRSQRELVVTEIDVRQALARLVSLGGGRETEDEAIKRCINNIDSELNARLGVEEWKE